MGRANGMGGKIGAGWGGSDGVAGRGGGGKG